MAGSDHFPEYLTPSKTGLDGPDQVLPSNVDRTCDANGCVRIKSDDGNRDREIISVPGLLMRTARKHGDHVAMISRPGVDGKSKSWTYKEYEDEVRTVARAFLKLGLERYHSVGIIGFNSPQWFIADIAAMYAGGLAVGIYTTNSAEACQYCAENSRANILVVEDAGQLKKILEVKDKLPHLKAIIQYDGKPKAKGVYSWDEVLEIGRSESNIKLNEVLKTIGVNECCTLVYTSGTVGKPKAVMVSHDSIVAQTTGLAKAWNFVEKQEVTVSYLPLSHCAAQLSDLYGPLSLGSTVHFADNKALKGTLIKTLVAARPTFFLGVPRVWEKIYENMIDVGRSNGPLKTRMATWAKTQGLVYNMNKMNGHDYKHWGYVMAKFFVFNRIKKNLGLDRCKIFITGAAPLSTKIQKYLMSLDMPIMDSYGMSESLGPHTINSPDKFRMGSVGYVVPGFAIKLNNPDSTDEGEICMQGPHVFMGYLNEPEKTNETMDDEGWLQTGDLGRIDSDGFLYITGRIKELVITAGGENVPPVPIEHALLAELPALSNAMLIGDARKFLTILVTLKTDMDPNTGGPLDTLTNTTRLWAKSIGSKATTVTEVLNSRDTAIYKEIQFAIDRTNARATNNAQRLQKFVILPHDFSVPTGELGPTMKVRRNVVANMYADSIDEMYR